jgi:hypothetical protein
MHKPLQHEKEISYETQQSQTGRDTLSHAQTLESNNPLPSDQRHSIRQAVRGPPKNRVNPSLRPNRERPIRKHFPRLSCKVAETKDEIKQLIEAGFEFVMQQGNLAYFRKRKQLKGTRRSFKVFRNPFNCYATIPLLGP